MKFLPAQFPWIWWKCLQSKFVHSKIIQSHRLQRSIVKTFTAHHACRSANLNLKLVSAATIGFIFQTINSLMEYCGRRWGGGGGMHDLAWLYCKPVLNLPVVCSNIFLLCFLALIIWWRQGKFCYNLRLEFTCNMYHSIKSIIFICCTVKG